MTLHHLDQRQQRNVQNPVAFLVRAHRVLHILHLAVLDQKPQAAQ